jgi:hypothetical protein
MIESLGDAWHTVRYDDLSTWGETLLTLRAFLPCNWPLVRRRNSLKGIAYVTNGLESPLQRVLNVNGVGARLTNLFEPPQVMKKIIELGHIPLK